MNTKRVAGITILMLILFLGCSGNYANLRNLSDSKSKTIQKELMDNWSENDIWLFYPTSYRPPQLISIIFDPKNDDRKILVGGDWREVKDQQKWTEVVRENTTSDGVFKIRRDYSDGTSTVQEIWGPDNQPYGYAINTAIWLVYTRLVEENTLQLEILRRNYNVTTAPP